MVPVRRADDRGVAALLEVAVDGRDAQKVEREIEEPLRLDSRPLASPHRYENITKYAKFA